MASKKPHPKVAAGGLAAAIVTVVVFAASQAGYTVDPGLAAALTTILGFAAAYLKPAA